MHIVFWISTTILAVFIFEFGRRIDRARYPDVSFGLVMMIFGLTWTAIQIGRHRMEIPPTPMIIVLAGFATLAAHYLYREAETWLVLKGYMKPKVLPERRKAQVHQFETTADMTERVNSMKRRSA